MKLRIKGNTLRLRLTRSEVAEFSETGRFSEQVSLTPAMLVYSIQKTDQNKAGARFSAGELTIFMPATDADEWAIGDEIGFEAKEPIDAENELHIIIEKAFA